MSANTTRPPSGELQRIRALRALILVAVAAATFAMLGILPSRAWGASSYKVLECNGAESSAAPDAVFSGSVNEGSWGSSVIQGWADCGNGGRGVYLHPSAASYGPRSGQVAFNAPPGTYFDSGTFVYDIGAYWPACAGGNPCWYADIHIGPWLQESQSTSKRTGTHPWTGCGGWCTQFRINVGCPWGFCVHYSDPDDWSYDYVAIKGINVTVVDTESPALTLGGSLFGNQVTHGTPRLQIDANDRGGGVEKVTAEVNGVEVGTPAPSCPELADDYATQLRPCNDFHKVVDTDTTKSPWRDGQNTLRVCAADVATGPGVANQVCEQRTVSVDNTCQDSQGATGEALSISAGLEDPQTGQLKRTRTVRSSDSAAIRGQLSGPSGPVKAASVCVYETVDEPAGIEQLLQVAKSSSTGNFGVEIPGGPSRSFRVAYRYNDREIVSPSMYLESSVLPTLEVTKPTLRNGRAVGFRGRIPGPEANGRAITMQAKVGKKWRSFKQLSTNANGYFKGKYRFTQTRGRVLYVFRALVKKQGGYPYSSGASPKRKVLVHG